MAKLGFLFPGQGSQTVGMGRWAAERSAAARQIFQRADAVLGRSLSTLCFEGPEDELKKTENTQPALYVASAATLEVLAEAGLEPGAVAGHSLGEYTALYAAGVFDFETGLRLVATRGKAFAEAGAARPGAMAAILGLDGDKVAAACAACSNDGAVVVPANYNDPQQTVISGDPAAVAAACEACKAAGAKRALPLPVSGAFHSPLVAPAADVMRGALADAIKAGASLGEPACLFVNNVDAAPQIEPARIAASLVAQVTSSVRWVECMRALVGAGVGPFIEVGSGKVLAGLAKRIAPDAVVHTTESAESWDKALAVLKA